MLFSASRPRGLIYPAAALLIALGAGPAWSGDYFLGPMDSLAIDQPRVAFALSDETDPLNPTLVGPNLYNLALLDTGANGILLGQLSFASQENYQQATTADGELAYYNELGVAGTEELAVHVPYGLRLPDPANPELGILYADDVIAFGADDIVLGSFAAIVGMPAMDGRVVGMDLRPVAQGGLLDPQFIASNFYTDISQTPFESAASLNVNLRMLPPEHTDTALPVEMRPTFAPLPVIDQIALTHTGGANSGGATLGTANTFLMDTGAQTTIISQAMALSLGLDISEGGADVIDYLLVGGIGGQAEMPLVVIDELRLPTADGVDLVFTNVLTGVLDIDGAPFDAVIGMNMLMSGYTAEVFGGSGGTTLTSPLVEKIDVEDDIELGVITSIEEMRAFGVITISDEDFNELVDLGLISDPDDLLGVFCELRELEESFGIEPVDGTFFDRVVFDFTATDGTGIMRLDLTALTQEGDANLDGFVGAEDLEILLANWEGSVRAGNVLEGDLTGDGLVNADDLNTVLAHWGEGTEPGTNVPEPASAALLGLGLLLLGRRRR